MTTRTISQTTDSGSYQWCCCAQLCFSLYCRFLFVLEYHGTSTRTCTRVCEYQGTRVRTRVRTRVLEYVHINTYMNVDVYVDV